MGPFILDLASFDLHLPARSGPRNPGAVEPVPPPRRLLHHFVQVAAEGQNRVGTGAEPGQLGMGLIPPGPAEQDLLSQEAFTPQSRKANSVQVLRMYRP